MPGFASSKQTLRVRGRYQVVFWVAIITTMLAILIARQYRGWQIQTRYDALRTEVEVEDAKRTALEADLATLMSRPVLEPKVKALGLRFPSDLEQVYLDVRGPR